MVESDFDQARAWAERAIDLATRLDDVEARVYATVNLGSAELQAGRPAGQAKLEEALELARAHGLEDYVGRAYSRVVMNAAQSHAYELVDAYLRPGLDFCRQRGLDTWRLYLLACQAQLDLARGDWTQAGDLADLVLRDPRSATYPRGIALNVLGLLRARRGDPAALDPLEHELATARQTEEPERIARASASRAEAAWLAGQAGQVGELTEAALRLSLQCAGPWTLGPLALWRWRAGIADRLPEGACPELYGASINGQWQHAADLWRALGCPYEEALALADGDEPDTVRQAHDQLVALGAAAAAAVVARRLRALGVRNLPRGPRAQTRANPAGLTSRELEVLALLAEGLRNAEIAQRLVVSSKTVDHHVSAILRKLDVRTRGDAAAKAHELAKDR
jgi:ATP/maltotriose-dependent transcriptional regulator MalT